MSVRRGILVAVLAWSCLFLVGLNAPGAHTHHTGFCALPTRPYITDAALPDGFCAITWASGLSRPRTLRFLSNGDAIVVETTSTITQSRSKITVLWDDNKDGVSSANERAVLLSNSQINHGLVIDEVNGYLYASTSKEVLRWHYSVGQRTPLGPHSTVINEIPCCGHLTRTLVLDANNYLYVSVGSLRNVDHDDKSAMIRRFHNPATFTETHRWDSGEIWARGMRNEVGLRFDYADPPRLWGVENGVDNLQRVDLGDIHNDNPAEEVNIFDKPGAFYGYPYCWSEYNLRNSILAPNARPGHKSGTQWVHPTFERDPRFSDAWCDDPNNVVKPVYNLQAHTAPLDIIFYNGAGSFPASWAGDGFIALHGSWNRPQPVGYNVVRLVVNETTGLPEQELPFFGPKDTRRHDGHESEEGEDPYPPVPGRWNIRPVALEWGPCGVSDTCLFITSDKDGRIIAVAYDSDHPESGERYPSEGEGGGAR